MIWYYLIIILAVSRVVTHVNIFIIFIIYLLFIETIVTE